MAGRRGCAGGAAYSPCARGGAGWSVVVVVPAAVVVVCAGGAIGGVFVFWRLWSCVGGAVGEIGDWAGR